MQKGSKLIIAFLFVLGFMAGCSTSQSSEQASANQDEEDVKLTISAAASLSDALTDIQDLYQEEHPEVTLKFNFAGSGSLKQQIAQGAPVDIFFSAAEDKFDELVDEGWIAEEDSVNLLGNSIVLVVSNEEESTINSFDDLVKDGVERISIGTPETVPAGKYSKEALENLKLWETVESKIVPAKDVRQVLSYVGTENVAAGMVYKTDALVSDDVTIVDEADSNVHTAIVYPVGIVKDSVHKEAAKTFYTFLQSEEALKVFEDYGFTIQ